MEIGLVKHVEKFLVEMGAGFAFMGRQYHINVSGDDYYIDILMYNVFLHRYLVIELKDTEFMPEYIGKLNFYCSAVDDILCREGDNRTIGLLLCKSKDCIKAEYDQPNALSEIPADLPREERVIDVPEEEREGMILIGYDESERIAYRTGLYVIHFKRAKYARSLGRAARCCYGSRPGRCV